MLEPTKKLIAEKEAAIRQLEKEIEILKSSPINLSAELKDFPDLSCVINPLRIKNIYTVFDLISKSEEDLLKVKHIGPLKLEYIKNWLKKYEKCKIKLMKKFKIELMKFHQFFLCQKLV